jgi:hypothetical protein
MEYVGTPTFFSQAKHLARAFLSRTSFRVGMAVEIIWRGKS